jgi:uncharacterized protein YwgA
MSWGMTSEESLTNKLLLLYLLENAETPMGDTKLHKLAFLSERNMNFQAEKGFNYNFIKLEWGPFSTDLKKDIDELVNLGLISRVVHSPTDRGRFILSTFNNILQRNSSFLDKIQKVNRDYAHLERDELVKIVHDMENPEKPWTTIHNTPKGKYILKRLNYALDDKIFQLTEDEIASLEIYFDQELFDSLVASLEEAKCKPAVVL